MKNRLSCFALIVLVPGMANGSPALAPSPAPAVVLDVPHPLHRPHAASTARAGQPHITDTHRTAAHSAAGKSATGKTATGKVGAPAAHAAAKLPQPAAKAHVQAANLAVHHRRPSERFTASSVLNDPGAGDITAGEDPTVRAALLDALGNVNGTAVVINPANGRILAMVNQSLALSPGAEPCSTIKLTVGLAALSEGLVTRDTPVALDGFHMNMTEAIAHSNNLYFEELGRELGFERVRHYANQFGLGELAGYNIAGEQLGTYPDQELPANEGGVGRMCSFGQGVSLTPLQLGAFVSAIANGGTLYYLQHPTSQLDVASFEPKIKRTLDIARFVPDLQDGMAGAVEYGTARRLRANFHELPVFGKTGTCSNDGTRYGWFASYSDSPQGSLVTVFFLEGGRPVFGPRAAELTGLFYRSLYDRNYFGANGPLQAQNQYPPLEPPALPVQ